MLKVKVKITFLCNVMLLRNLVMTLLRCSCSLTVFRGQILYIFRKKNFSNPLYSYSSKRKHTAKSMCSIANICKTQPRSACRFHHSFPSSTMGRSSYKKPNDSPLYLNRSGWKYNNLSNSARLDNESPHCRSLRNKAQSCRTWSKAGDQSG